MRSSVSPAVSAVFEVQPGNITLAAMQHKPATLALRADSDHLMGVTDVLLEVQRVVTGDNLRAALFNFRRWDHLVRKPLPVSGYALHHTDTRDFLQSVDIPSDLVDKVFDVFARGAARANSWSRALGDTPGPRVDALELFAALALTCRDTFKERLSTLFSLFDTGGTGVLVEDDLGALVSSCGSFLRRLRLVLPISNDEAAFVAGGAIGVVMGQSNSRETRCPDEMDRSQFMEWAHRSDLVANVMGLLALPHRLSRTVDMVSTKILPLRERYSNAINSEEEPMDRRARGHLSQRNPVSDAPRNMWLSEERVSKLLREHGTNVGHISFKLPPVMSGIGPHDANVVMEAGVGPPQTVNGSAWRVVATVERRTGSIFSVADARPLLLQGGAPVALHVSGLRAGTDHRLHLVWNAFGYTYRSFGRDGQEGVKRRYRTLRFRTLPSRSSTTSRTPNCSRIIPARRCHSRDQIRCSVTVIRTYCDARVKDPSEDIMSPVDGVAGEKEYSAPLGRGVSLIIAHRRLTSLEADSEPESRNSRWVSERRVVCEGDRDQHTRTEQPRCTSPSEKATGQHLFTSAPGLPSASPSGTEDIPTAAAALAAKNQPWSGEGVAVGDTDITVHLSPNWQAPEVVRRCLCMLEECRFEIPAVREDAKRHVSREVLTAVRSLLSKSGQSQRRALRDSGERHGAHIILGDVQPWLGLEEEEVLYHREEHCAIVHSAIESALQRYLWNPGMCGGGCSLTCDNGGMMALGTNCFLFRLSKQRNPSPPSTARHESGGSSVSARWDSPSHENSNDARSGAESGSGQQEMGAREDALDPTLRKRGGAKVEGSTDNVSGGREAGCISFTKVVENPELGVPGSTADTVAIVNCDTMPDNSGSDERISKTELVGGVLVGAGAASAAKMNGSSPPNTSQGGGGLALDTDGTRNRMGASFSGIKHGDVLVMDSPASVDSNDTSEQNQKGEGATSDTSVWREDAYVGVLEKERTTVGVADGATDGVASLTGKLSGQREGNEHTDAKAHDPELGAQSVTSEKATRLEELLRGMTTVAKAAALNAAKKGGTDDGGTTAVVLLDAPLISPKTLSAFEESRRRTSHIEGNAPRTDSLQENDADIINENNAKDEASARRQVSDNGNKVDNDENQQNEGDGSLAAAHPAGLGDPVKALEALMSWIREGQSMGPGHRDIVLVCGSYGAGVDLSKEVETLNQVMFVDANGGYVPDHDGVSEIAVGRGDRTSIDKAVPTGSSSNSGIDDEHDNGIRADDVHVAVADVSANGGHEGESSSRGKGSANNNRPAIKQVVLGGMMTAPPPDARQEHFSEKGPTFTRRAQENINADDDKPTVTEAGQGNRPSQSELSLQVRSSVAQQMRWQLHRSPSEVLLETQPLSERRGSRLILSFPPNATYGFVPTGTTILPDTPINASSRTVERTEGGELSRRDNDRPRVVVGPIIGRVGPTSAVILVEVDRTSLSMAVSARDRTATAGDVGVQLTDTLSGRGHEVVGGYWTGQQPGAGPRVFEFEGLTQGRRYSVRLTGVRQRDQAARTGGLSTPLEGEAPPAIWAVSPLACPSATLEEMMADVQTARPTATTIINTGPMVDASKVAQALYPLVAAEQQADSKGVERVREGGLSVEARALTAFRELYRDTWSNPQTRKLLANCSTLASSDGAGTLLLPLLRSFPSGWLPVPCPPSSNMSRACRRDEPESTARQNCRGKRPNRLIRRGKVKLSEGGEKVSRSLRAVAGAAVQVSREYQEALRGRAYCGSIGGADYANDGVGVGVSGKGALPAFQRWGAVGVLTISVFSSQVELAFGERDAGCGLLSAEAWTWLRRFFRSPEVGLQEGPGVNTLIVATDSPLLWRSASAARSAECRSSSSRNAQFVGGNYGNVGPVGSNSCRDTKSSKRRPSSCKGHAPSIPSWSARPREAAALLELLFSWTVVDAPRVGDGEPASARETQPAAVAGGAVGAGVETSSLPRPIASEHGSDTAGVARRGKEPVTVGGTEGGRTFTILCPSNRVRTNIQTYVRDGETGRVAVQWCMASKETGDEALISMSGSIGDRFSFTHYPQGGESNGPGVTLLRPLPDPSAPWVTFLGMVSRGSGGPGLALGTLGPVLGEIGTTTATVLVEVSVPMELCLAVTKAGSKNREEAEKGGDWRELRRVVHTAHRPVVFDVDGLIPDTRYLLEFSPLANADAFRASLRTRALRPFSFRVVAFGGAQKPFGFLETQPDGGNNLRDETAGTRARLQLADKWPYSALDTRTGGDCSAVGGAGGVDREQEVERGFGGSSHEGVWVRGGGDAAAGCSRGGGWRNAFSAGLAIDAAVDGSKLVDMERDRLFGGGSDALQTCPAVCDRSAWKVLSDEVALPGQGLDLVIHLGNEINMAECLSGTEVAELLENADQWVSPTSSEELSGGGKRRKRPLLVHPPQLPVNDSALRGRDEDDVLKLESFFRQVHDRSERDRKLGKLGTDGNLMEGQPDARRKPIQEPVLEISLPEDERVSCGGVGSSRGGEWGGVALKAGGDFNGGDEGRGESDVHGEAKDDGRRSRWGDEEAWALAAEEIAERVRDAYRVAWGLPWAKSVMSRAPNSSLAFTPLDLDDGCLRLLPKPSPLTTPGSIADTTATDAVTDHPASASRLREESLRAWAEYQGALAGGKAASDAAAMDLDRDNKEASGRGGKPKRESDRGAYREYGGIGVMMLDVWGNQPWRLDEKGAATAKGEEGPGFHPKSLLSKRQEKLVKKALASPSTNALLVCSGTPMVAEPIVHPKAPPLTEDEQWQRDKALKFAKKELKKLGKAGLAEIKKMEEEEKVPKLSLLSPDEVGPMDAFYDETRPCFHWSYHSPYLQEFLEKLFDWASEAAVSGKKGGPPKKRDVVLLCGGAGSGVRTVVRDRRTGLSFSQICVGHMSDAAKPCPWSLSTGAIGDRIVYTHSPAYTHPGRNYSASSGSDSIKGGVESGGRAAGGGTSHAVTIGGTPTGTVGVPLGDDAGINPERERISKRMASVPGDHHDFVAGSNTRSEPPAPADGGVSSYALVTILSEPLDARVDAMLIQPPYFQEGAAQGSNSTTRTTDAAIAIMQKGKSGFSVGTEKSLSGSDIEAGAVLSESVGVSVILGPVVGKVGVVPQAGVVRESCHVPVVLEVDRDGPVTCVMRDVSTSEMFRLERGMKARRPRAFWMQGLRAGRRYHIQFEGVSGGGDRTGTLTTPDSSQPDLTLVAVSHDRPGELPSGGEVNLWGALGDRLGSPWQGVHAVIHVGGQVDLSNAFEDGRAFLECLETRRKNGRVSAEEEAAVMDSLKERFREEYRKVWNQPSTRRVLASCQHVMMWGQGECRKGYGRGGHAAVSSWAGRRLLRVAKEVFREYQRQLWDPRWGQKFEVGENESFFTSFLSGTIGILSLDMVELSPRWQGSTAANKKGKTGSAGKDGELEEPLIGDSQWQRLHKALEKQASLVTLIVVTELPVAWHDTEEFVKMMQDPTAPPHLGDHWAARPTQQRALLTRLFGWKADGGGREVILLAGAGRAEGSAAAETNLELRMHPPPAQQTAVLSRGEAGHGGGGEDGEQEQITTEAQSRLVTIAQVTCGPITADPMDLSVTSGPIKGKLLVPLTEAEKIEKRRRKAKGAGDSTGRSQGSQGSQTSRKASQGSPLSPEAPPDPDPVDFAHIQTAGRNYAVLQVIADKDDEGPIGVVDTAIATSSSLEKAHPLQELSRPPQWWSKRCIGDRTILFEDDVYLKGRGFKGVMEARLWLETSPDFKEATRRCYDDFYIADAGRPVELRTIRVEKAGVLKRKVEDGIRAVYRTLPEEVASQLAFVPDKLILDYLLIKACPEAKASALDSAEKWEEVCRQTCVQAAYIRVAALWSEEEEEVVLTAAARAEEVARKAEAKQKRQQELEVKEAERDAAEMADLMVSDPEAHMRRVVQKRADDADRRKREAKEKAALASVAAGELGSLEARKEQDRERLALAAKEKEAKEQQDLNTLADTDPEEYDRRIKEWHKRKIEGRDGPGGRGGGVGGGDESDRKRSGDLERRKSLARERRDARRAEMHKRPSVGISKKKKS